MAEQFSIEDIFKRQGLAPLDRNTNISEEESLDNVFKKLGIPPLKNNPNKKEYNVNPTTTNGARTKKEYAQGEELFDKDETKAKSKLKKKDLYSYKNLNIIREYMTRSKGVDYEEAKDTKLVEDFVDHMRWFN